MLGLFLVGAVLLSACGGIGPPRGSTGQGGGDVNINWDQPLPGGVLIADPAQASLAFAPDVPTGLGAAEGIFATAGDYESVALHEIAWVYNDPAYGRFVVIERVAESQAWQTEIANLVAETPGCVTVPADQQTEKDFGAGAEPAIECHLGNRSVVTIRNGVTAFLLETDQVTSIEWLESLSAARANALERQFDTGVQNLAVQVVVVGLANELTADEAIAIAEKV